MLVGRVEKVLFVCVHGAGRAPMAAALFNRFADPERAAAIAAGTRPAARVHPEALAAMKEIGIDLADAVPQSSSDELARTVSVLVTMGCGANCPVAPGVERHDWPIEETNGKPRERVYAIRNELRDRVRKLLAAKGWARDSAAAAANLTPARTDDANAIRELLAISQLPVEGLERAFPDGFVVARAPEPVGCAGLEVYEEAGLLRSVAVGATGRHHGLGSKLVEDRVAAARSKGLAAVYAITTTAAPFFERLGFVPVERSTVPAGIRSSAEFTTICPSSAAVLRLSLKS